MDYPYSSRLNSRLIKLNTHDSVAELKAAVEEVWDNPMLSAHLYRTHATAVNAVHSRAGGPASKGRKRKHLPDPETAEAQPEVRALEEKLETISLQCWGYDSYHMRSSVPDLIATCWTD